MTSAHLLNAAGTLLYGPLWQSELARATGTNLRTMQRWAKGEFEPSSLTLWRDLDTLLAQRQLDITYMRQMLVPQYWPNPGPILPRSTSDMTKVRKRFPA